MKQNSPHVFPSYRGINAYNFLNPRWQLLYPSHKYAYLIPELRFPATTWLNTTGWNYLSVLASCKHSHIQCPCGILAVTWYMIQWHVYQTRVGNIKCFGTRERQSHITEWIHQKCKVLNVLVCQHFPLSTYIMNILNSMASQTKRSDCTNKKNFRSHISCI